MFRKNSDLSTAVCQEDDISTSLCAIRCGTSPGIARRHTSRSTTHRVLCCAADRAGLASQLHLLYLPRRQDVTNVTSFAVPSQRRTVTIPHPRASRLSVKVRNVSAGNSLSFSSCERGSSTGCRPRVGRIDPWSATMSFAFFDAPRSGASAAAPARMSSSGTGSTDCHDACHRLPASDDKALASHVQCSVE
jgi:hypothetical protein